MISKKAIGKVLLDNISTYYGELSGIQKTIKALYNLFLNELKKPKIQKIIIKSVKKTIAEGTQGMQRGTQ